MGVPAQMHKFPGFWKLMLMWDRLWLLEGIFVAWPKSCFRWVLRLASHRWRCLFCSYFLHELRHGCNAIPARRYFVAPWGGPTAKFWVFFTKEYFAFLQEPLAASRCDPEESLLQFPLTMNCTVLEDQAIGSRCLNFPLFSLSSLFLSVSQKQVLTQKSYCSGILHLDKFALYTKQLWGLWCIGCEDGSGTASAGTHFCFFTPCPCLPNVNLNLEAASVATFSLMNWPRRTLLTTCCCFCQQQLEP